MLCIDQVHFVETISKFSVTYKKNSKWKFKKSHVSKFCQPL
jgi:hypothetical protein